MTTATKDRPRIAKLSEGDWLYRLLFDVQRQVASRPSPQAVERIRQRLFVEMQRPAARAAA